jgi:holo-[acyl-carrier protein] synthase
VIVGSGVDLCEVARIKDAIVRYGRRFVERIYTDREIAYAQSKANLYERYAARFARFRSNQLALRPPHSPVPR